MKTVANNANSPTPRRRGNPHVASEKRVGDVATKDQFVRAVSQGLHTVGRDIALQEGKVGGGLFGSKSVSIPLVARREGHRPVYVFPGGETQHIQRAPQFQTVQVVDQRLTADSGGSVYCAFESGTPGGPTEQRKTQVKSLEEVFKSSKK